MCRSRGVDATRLCGVPGPAVSAALALDAVSRDAKRDSLDEISFVLSDAAFVAFGKVFELLAGPPDEEGAWHLAPDDSRLDGLDLARVPELAPREARPNRGYAGDHWKPSEAGWR